MAPSRVEAKLVTTGKRVRDNQEGNLIDTPFCGSALLPLQAKTAVQALSLHVKKICLPLCVLTIRKELAF